VAVQLGIDFKMYDFEAEYRQRVVDYMVAGYQAGITPNPDIMCNQEVKFKLFLQAALDDGADMIATGHYARIENDEHRSAADGAGTSSLFTGVDNNKDQSYFLYRVTEAALAKSLMPIGELKKPAVRELAKKFGLATAEKKDSQGICFVGKVGIKDFLLAELGPQPLGAIIDPSGLTIGEHDGALFYTIGQRHGLDVGGGLPYYVVGKDMTRNEVYVTTDLQDDRLWHKELRLTSLHWINQPPESGRRYDIRTRYRAPLIGCQVSYRGDSNDHLDVVLDDDVRAITPGQSAVIYDGQRVVGGGIVI
jgi:tRNA-specific 2-thiouridylase